MGVMKYIGAAYILWLAIHIVFSKPSTENAEQSASFLKGFMLQFVNVKIYMFGVTALPGQPPGRKAQRSASRTAGTTVPEIQLRPPDGLPWAQLVGQRCDHAESGREDFGALCRQHWLQGTAGVSGYKAGTSFGADESQGKVRCPGVQSHRLPESEGRS